LDDALRIRRVLLLQNFLFLVLGVLDERKQWMRALPAMNGGHTGTGYIHGDTGLIFRISDRFVPHWRGRCAEIKEHEMKPRRALRFVTVM
jgi:hypothetical protein